MEPSAIGERGNRRRRFLPISSARLSSSPPLRVATSALVSSASSPSQHLSTSFCVGASRSSPSLVSPPNRRWSEKRRRQSAWRPHAASVSRRSAASFPSSFALWLSCIDKSARCGGEDSERRDNGGRTLSYIQLFHFSPLQGDPSDLPPSAASGCSPGSSAEPSPAWCHLFSRLSPSRAFEPSPPIAAACASFPQPVSPFASSPADSASSPALPAACRAAALSPVSFSRSREGGERGEMEGELRASRPLDEAAAEDATPHETAVHGKASHQNEEGLKPGAHAEGERTHGTRARLLATRVAHCAHASLHDSVSSDASPARDTAAQGLVRSKRLRMREARRQAAAPQGADTAQQAQSGSRATAACGVSAGAPQRSAALASASGKKKGSRPTGVVGGKEKKREKKRERARDGDEGGDKEETELSNLRAEARRLGLPLRKEFAEHTFDPRYSANVRLSADRLTVTGNKNWGTALARCCCRQGSWYFEVTIGSAASARPLLSSSSSSSSLTWRPPPRMHSASSLPTFESLQASTFSSLPSSAFSSLSYSSCSDSPSAAAPPFAVRPQAAAGDASGRRAASPACTVSARSLVCACCRAPFSPAEGPRAAPQACGREVKSEGDQANGATDGGERSQEQTLDADAEARLGEARDAEASRAPEGKSERDEGEEEEERMAEVGEDAKKDSRKRVRRKGDAREFGKSRAEKEDKRQKVAAGEPLTSPVVGWGICRTLKNVLEEHPESFLSNGIDGVAPCVRVGWGSRLSNFLAPVGTNCFGYALSSYSPHAFREPSPAAQTSGAASRASLSALPCASLRAGKTTALSHASAPSTSHATPPLCPARGGNSHSLFVVNSGKRKRLRRGFLLPQAGSAHVRLLSSGAKTRPPEDAARTQVPKAPVAPGAARQMSPSQGDTDGRTGDNGLHAEAAGAPAGDSVCGASGRQVRATEACENGDGPLPPSRWLDEDEALPPWEEVDEGLKEGDVVGCYIHLPGDEPPASLDDPRGLAQLWTFLQQGLLCDVTNDSTLPRAVRYPKSFVSFSLNGALFPRCFHDINTAEFHPAVSVFNGASATINLGPDFQFLSGRERAIFRPACELGISMYPLKLDLVKFWLLSAQSEIVVDPETQCAYRRQRTLAEVDGDWDRARTFARMAATGGRLEFTTTEERRKEERRKHARSAVGAAGESTTDAPLEDTPREPDGEAPAKEAKEQQDEDAAAWLSGVPWKDAAPLGSSLSSLGDNAAAAVSFALSAAGAAAVHAAAGASPASSLATKFALLGRSCS
ncbi:hypothetical protein BESB_001420 [Besnoitia besnoiti]|uniref:SPRY domain-containing protein n=1 Tax=Besnoitia besnoiti TaxID=94643 RepID=A0A2A9MPM2_BESBE|nr:hypothetical protein BESB_001420 [Besnoitia besnoiti]PFH37800.1 hypothetical protein BESB_001420 [Besnoitia besnoiti]